MKPEDRKKRKSNGKFPTRTFSDMAIGLGMAKREILAFQREVAGNPDKFLKPLPATNGNRGLPASRSNTNETRKETQEKILHNICLRIEEISLGQITQKDIEQAIEVKCITRTLSTLYASTYQWNEQNKKLEILETAGTPFQKEEGGEGVRAGGICHAFLRQNGLTKKISHKDMAIELKATFEETFQKVRGQMEEDGYEINEGQLKKILAAELFRRTGGRSNNAYLISSAKEAAQRFCERIEPERSSFLALQQSAQMTIACNLFVENQIPEDLRQHLLQNPLKPVYERNPSGGVLLHPDTGKPVLNQALPEKWRKEEIPTEIEAAFQRIAHPEKKEEVGTLLDTLRLPRKMNIPLNAALEELLIALPSIPLVLKTAQEAEKSRMAYEIAKAAHSLAYRLGIATAAAGEGLLNKEDLQTLNALQTQVNAFPEGMGETPLNPSKLALPGETPTTTLTKMEEIWRKSTLALEKARKTPSKETTPAEDLDPEKPKSHEPVFSPIQ